jgi:hypothetical protein
MFRNERRPQTLANHKKFVPVFHGFAFGVLLLQLVWSSWQLVRAPGLGTALGVLLALALLVLFLAMRVFALGVQDRVIRLEERLRLERLLPADLRPRVGELDTGDLVALRFASDAELPELVRAVLDGRLRGRDAIKRAIRDWRPDYCRI